MVVAIPPEFERYAREAVSAGAFASEQEAVEVVLRDYLSRLAELRTLIDPGLQSLDRGEGEDADAVFDRMEAALEARITAAGG
jgi:Arc/MetJ-type ribon-helix-helix transcriptional regulator